MAKEFQQTSTEPIFYNHRPASAEDIPVELMHAVFGRFRDNTTSRPPDLDDVKFTVDLCAAMSGYYKVEADRVEDFIKLLEKHYKIHTHGVIIRKSNVSTDATFLVEEHMIMNGEGRNEPGRSGNPTIQNTGYYGKHIVGLDETVAATHRLPVFLIDQAGPILTLNMAIYGSKIIVDPFPFALNLACSTHDMATFTRVLGALKEGIMELSNYYKEKPLPTIPREQRKFPYFASYPGPGDTEAMLRYCERLVPQAPHLVFLASESIGSTERNVIVKFSRSYGVEAHRLCQEHGLAPDLIYTKKLDGGWTVVVMAHITSPFKLLSECKSTELMSLQPVAKAAVKQLHDAGFVHGDLRATNIFGDPIGGVVKIIDWDWAGTAGMVKYPEMMNPVVGHAKGARMGEDILATHDLETLSMIFSP
ncbi:hypothetical protein BD410DRAFT_780553 [Rickenella mellea]|uniref:Protein kinase domain-containing protein n=1 Tax=Rickenella mellea TaxID=50990 RepID=A0A4R5XHU2_9AGAM|nr:hypothetical protein BD410DRAFT_780553 [Rickenella mellea]